MKAPARKSTLLKQPTLNPDLSNNNNDLEQSFTRKSRISGADQDDLFNSQVAANPIELDLFGIEVKSRKMIHDLINPLVEKMNEERAMMAAYNERAQGMEERMVKLECMNGITEVKPKIFQDIDNEFADMKQQSASFESRINDQIQHLNEKSKLQEDTMTDMDKVSQNLILRSDQMDQLMRDVRSTLTKLNEKFMLELDGITSSFKETLRQTQSDIRKVEQNIMSSQSRLTEELAKLETMEKIMEKQGIDLVKVAQQTNFMKDKKVDLDLYNEQHKHLSDEVRTIKFATQDTYRTLMATDNYLEKYLPFKIQEIVSENIKHSFDQIPDSINKLRDHEYQKYKDQHRIVMKDTGISNFEKRGYIAPGQNVMMTNKNDDFIPELATRVVSQDWYLSRNSLPVSDEDLNREKAEINSFGEDPPLVSSQTQFHVKPRLMKSFGSSDSMNHHHHPKQGAGGFESRPSIMSSPGGGPGHNSKKMLPITMEDLDPDFAYEIFENFNSIKEFTMDIQRIKHLQSESSQAIEAFVKEAHTNFRAEVRQSITQHFEYMKEVHTEVENSIKKNQTEYQQMANDVKVAQQDLKKISGIKEFQEQTQLFMEQIKLLSNELCSIMRIQNDLNMESAINSMGQQDEVRQSHAALMMSYQNLSGDDFQAIKQNQANLILTPSSNQQQKYMKSTIFQSSEQNSMFSPLQSQDISQKNSRQLDLIKQVSLMVDNCMGLTSQIGDQPIIDRGQQRLKSVSSHQHPSGGSSLNKTFTLGIPHIQQHHAVNRSRILSPSSNLNYHQTKILKSVIKDELTPIATVSNSTSLYMPTPSNNLNINNDQYLGSSHYSITNQELKLTHHPHVRLHSANNTSKKRINTITRGPQGNITHSNIMMSRRVNQH